MNLPRKTFTKKGKGHAKKRVKIVESTLQKKNVMKPDQATSLACNAILLSQLPRIKKE